MTRVGRLALLPAVALTLSGCVAGMAASAVGMAAGSRQERPHRNVELILVTARDACTAYASQYGAVEITGIKQADGNEVIVSGTVTAANGKQAFECSYVTQITEFDLRPIRAGT